MDQRKANKRDVARRVAADRRVRQHASASGWIAAPVPPATTTSARLARIVTARRIST
ncbi:hypothetical protein FAGKG844_60147 [Frankia sp. AgKG'84/4]